MNKFMNFQFQQFFHNREPASASKKCCLIFPTLVLRSYCNYDVLKTIYIVCNVPAKTNKRSNTRMFHSFMLKTVTKTYGKLKELSVRLQYIITHCTPCRFCYIGTVEYSQLKYFVFVVVTGVRLGYFYKTKSIVSE